LIIPGLAAAWRSIGVKVRCQQWQRQKPFADRLQMALQTLSLVAVGKSATIARLHGFLRGSAKIYLVAVAACGPGAYANY
jgi:hypothetical protein